jgi:molecular chaperone DnaK
MVDLFLRDQNVDLRADDLAMQRLRSVAEQIKIQLSRRDRAIVKIDAIAYAHGGRALDLDLEIGREELVSRCAHVVEETFPVCDEALRLAQIRRPQITDVVLVGGTTRMPYIIERAARYFGRRPRVDVSPEEAVALGAALQAEALARRVAPATPLPPPPIERPESESEITDYRSGITDPDSLVRYETGVTEPQSGGFETDATDREVAVAPPPRLEARPNDRDVPVPPPPPPRLETRMTDRLAAVPPPPPPPPRATPPPPAWPGSDTGAQTVPRGEPFAPAPTVAARPTAKRSGDLLDELGLGGAAAPTIREVAPHTLGIGTVAGYCEAIIRRNTPIPQRTSRKFMTSRDGQRVVRLMVFQGESRLLHENRRLGALVLEGLPPRPRGETEIEVAFAVNESGMLEVAAVDTLTGAERRATVELIGAPSDDEVTESKVRMQRIRERK